MASKISIKLKDNICNHEPSFFTDTESIHYIKNILPGGDLEVNENDIVMYTDLFLTNDMKGKKNIAILIESPEYHRPHYEYVSKHNNKFDLVLTFDKRLLDREENFKLNLFGTCSLHDSYIHVWFKSKLNSMIISNKNMTSGHRFRHTVANYISSNNISVDIYGPNYIFLPQPTTRAFEADHSSRHITNGKINALKDYMFSVTIENNKQDYYFTEKIIDCFLTGTVPIYYGCPSIGKFFNINGIIVIDSLDDIIRILPTITVDLYNQMKPYIEENYKTAQKYKTFVFNEEAILDVVSK